MNRLEINLQTGEERVIALTAEEIAEIEARPVPVPAPVRTLADQILADPVELAKLKAALGLP